MATNSQENTHSIEQTARLFFSAAKSDGKFGTSLRDCIQEYLQTDPKPDIIACLCFSHRSKFFQRRGYPTYYSPLAWTIYHENTQFWNWMYAQSWFHQRRLERSIICRSGKKSKSMSLWTPLLFCVRIERHEMVLLLLEQFNPNIDDTRSGLTPFMFACQKADIPAMKPLLLRDNMDFFATDSDDCSILHRTGKGKDLMFSPHSTWCLLVTQERCGLDFINEQDRFGMTPLHYVTYYKRHGWRSNVLILLSFGARPSLKKKTNSKGKVPFDFLSELDAMLFMDQLENEEVWRCIKKMICDVCLGQEEIGGEYMRPLEAEVEPMSESNREFCESLPDELQKAVKDIWDDISRDRWTFRSIPSQLKIQPPIF